MPTPTVIPSVAEIVDFVGCELGSSNWVTISQERINAFADATDDHQWLHVDVERAQRDSPFKSTVAHGYLTISLIPALLRELLVVNNCEMAVNAGIEKLRLSTPVPSGSRLRMSATLKGARKLPGGGIRSTFAIRLELEGATKPACHGNVTYVYYP
jgi:acyl dehydratase